MTTYPILMASFSIAALATETSPGMIESCRQFSTTVVSLSAQVGNSSMNKATPGQNLMLLNPLLTNLSTAPLISTCRTLNHNQLHQLMLRSGTCYLIQLVRKLLLTLHRLTQSQILTELECTVKFISMVRSLRLCLFKQPTLVDRLGYFGKFKQTSTRQTFYSQNGLPLYTLSSLGSAPLGLAINGLLLFAQQIWVWMCIIAKV